MGLDISPGGAHWAYSGFQRFRAKLATAEGFDLSAMQGFRPHGARADWVGRSWDEINSALKPLLNHSDCDGEMTPEECAEVLTRLPALIAKWPADDYDRHQADALIDGMRECVESGENLKFR